MPEHSVKHDYHLVDPSPWPVVGALGAFIAMVGVVFWLNKGYAGFGVLAGIPWIFAIGLALVLFTAAGWWRDVIVESVVEGRHSPVVKLGFRYGMALFLVAEAMFFAVWLWAWFDFALFPHDAGLPGWPPPGITPFDPWVWPLLASLILLTSATTVTWADHAIGESDKLGTIAALVVTLALGAGFLAVQAIQLPQAPFGFGFSATVPFTDAHPDVAGQGSMGAIYGSIFFLVTGIFIVQVVIGLLFLLVCLVRALLGHFKPDRHFGFEAAAWYWHFLVALWLIVFAVIYLRG